MDNNEDNIRLPDEVKIDRLIDNDFYDYEYNNENIVENPIWSNRDHDLERAIEISKNEFTFSEEREREERGNKLKNTKIQLKKIIFFDRNNLHYYELILSIIEMYEHCLINEYKTFKKEYNDIFNVLKTIRLPSDELENLKKIILCE